MKTGGSTKTGGWGMAGGGMAGCGMAGAWGMAGSPPVAPPA